MTNVPLMLIGEAYGEAEVRLSLPFVGPSGAALLRMLGESHLLDLNKTDSLCIHRYYETTDANWIAKVWRAHPEVRRTNVFNLHPLGNDLDTLCGPKSSALPGYPAIAGSRYIRAEFEPELDRLSTELLSLNPNLVICLGNTPLWALGGRVGIKKWRGTTFLSTHCAADFKCLATYHPSAVQHMYSLRPIAIADFMKAKRESTTPELRRTAREIWIEPELDDVARWFATWRDRYPSRLLSTDIETAGSRITCIGFGTSEFAIVVPFDDERTASGNYWPTIEAERACWGLIREVLEDPTIPKLFQNGLYDIAFLWRSMRIKVLGAAEDTMLAHHALQPEMIKDLGFLGSVYADEAAWKHLGKGKRRTKTIKRDA